MFFVGNSRLFTYLFTTWNRNFVSVRFQPSTYVCNTALSKTGSEECKVMRHLLSLIPFPIFLLMFLFTPVGSRLEHLNVLGFYSLRSVLKLRYTSILSCLRRLYLLGVSTQLQRQQSKLARQLLDNRVIVTKVAYKPYSVLFYFLFLFF